jgi:hypothetical protein
MKQIETDIVIHSSAETVWQVLTTFENYSEWNPFIQSISGGKKAGKRIKVTINRPNGKSMTFNPEILIYEPNREFRWKGKLGLKGIFDGEHYFILEEKDDNRTKFIHGEKFSGILVLIMGSSVDNLRSSFEMMNAAIKNECERK